jgi:hypothetical protein
MPQNRAVLINNRDSKHSAKLAREKRRLLPPVALLFLALSAVSPAAVHASSAYVDTYHARLTYIAAKGEANNVTFSRSGTTVEVTDSGATVSPGNKCTRVTDHQVTCTGTINYVGAGTDDMNDTITLSGSIPSWVDAGSGNDVLKGGSSSDWLFGNTGDDTLDGGLGADLLSGGDGNDLADYSGRTNAVTISLDGQPGDGETGENDNVSSSIENVTTGSGNDTVTGSALANTLSGGPGNDGISGAGGDDTLDGGLGQDSVDGGDGNDRLASRDAAVDADRCGAGTDSVTADILDTVAADCEQVDRGVATPANRSTVLDLIPRVLPMTRDGWVRLRLRCPKKFGERCRGTIRLELPGNGARQASVSRAAKRTVLASTRYSLRPGHKKVIRVHMSRNGRWRVLRNRKLKCSASAVTRHKNGTKTRARKTVTIKAPKKRKSSR